MPDSANHRKPQAATQKRPRTTDQGWRRHNIGRLLNNAIQRFEKRILEQMEQAGHGGCSLSHIGVTRNLDIEGTRATELARRAGMTKQAMGELIAQLEERGLVERRPDPIDRRARIVYFSDQGLEWLNAFHIALDRAESEMRREIGAAGLELMKQALEKYGAREEAHAALPHG
ncbi:MarR family protein [Noviherbaspirillum humi]|uniref:MarR family protein n=1 Tax=Noviherbaspirillum humi TaxID=1688639 RepID=A0A239I773_9BURK|nr:MarR family transcriptional regulator [Noviherbaspirillum humi]SNS88174.1 MarR family protein [Noviherbaspirillum humi]